MARKIAEVELGASSTCSAGQINEIVAKAQPTVLKGYAADWDLVKSTVQENGEQSAAAVSSYLQSWYNQGPVHLMSADEEQNGRLFYKDDLSGFNFSRSRVKLDDVLEQIMAAENKSPAPTFYVGSTAVDSVLPNFRSKNDLQHMSNQALISIWISNRSRVSAHHDAPDNIAVVAAGKRRFTLFAPEQINNLYIGPLDYTPAGQAASLVDFHNPDFERFPRFKQALEVAQVAELEAGDAIYIPSMWWHHVESLSSINVLVNYWWRQVESYIGVPNDALYHAMLSIKALPEAQRQAWKHIFEHYVFSPKDNSHIPEDKLGILADVDDKISRQLRAVLLNKLNR